MDEQLQKELLEILRAMKDGASPAWQMLVEQRSLYCWVNMVIPLLLLVAMASGSWLLISRALRAKGGWTVGVDLTPRFFQMLVGVGLAIFCLIPICEISRSLPGAIVPMGQLLEMLR